MGSKKSSSESHSQTKVDMYNDQYAHQERFTSPEMKQAWGDLYGKAKQNYDDTGNLYNQALKDYKSGKSPGDNSYFKQGWNGLSTVGMDNINKMNSADLNAYNDPVTRNFINASNAASRLAWGDTYNQALQNMIGTGMYNGSGHQTAMAKVGAQLAANMNAQNQATYAARQSQLEQNAKDANNILTNYWNGMTDRGLSAWDKSQQGYAQAFNNALQAQNARDNAIRVLGNTVEMNADPTMVTRQHQHGITTTDANSTTKTSQGLGDIIGGATGLFTPIKWFG